MGLTRVKSKKRIQQRKFKFVNKPTCDSDTALWTHRLARTIVDKIHSDIKKGVCYQSQTVRVALAIREGLFTLKETEGLNEEESKSREEEI